VTVGKGANIVRLQLGINWSEEKTVTVGKGANIVRLQLGINWSEENYSS